MGPGHELPLAALVATSWIDAVAARSPSTPSSPSALAIVIIGLVPTGEAPEVAVVVAGADQIWSASGSERQGEACRGVADGRYGVSENRVHAIDRRNTHCLRSPFARRHRQAFTIYGILEWSRARRKEDNQQIN